MTIKTKKVSAVYKGGSLHPVEPLELPENSVVEVTVSSEGEKINLDALLERVQSRFSGLPPEEIQRDIMETIREVRKP